MPKINEIISSEQSKDRLCIQLYSEGIFYKAYEHSAWLAYHILNRFIQTMPAVSERSISLCFCGASHSRIGVSAGMLWGEISRLASLARNDNQ